MSKSYFINRHGKKLDIDESVPTTPAQASPSVDASSTPPVISKKRMRKFTLSNLRPSRKLIFVIIAALVLVLLVAFLTADLAKRTYQQQTSDMKNSVIELSTQISSTETPASNVVSDLRSQLTASTDCHTDSGILAEIYPLAKRAGDECRQTADAYLALRTSLDDMKKAISYLEEQKDILAGALSHPTGGAFAEIPAEVDTWKAAREKLEKLSAPEVLTDAHAALISRVEAIETTWKELQTAFKGQDADGFTATETKLKKAYEALRDSATDMQKAISETQQAVNTALVPLRAKP